MLTVTTEGSMHSAVVQMYPDGRLDRANAARYTGFSVKTLAMHATGRPFMTLVPGHPSQLPVGAER